MNVKTTLYLICVGLKRCFIKFSFHFEGVLLAVRGALACSGGARAPSKPLILRPCTKEDRLSIGLTVPEI